MAIAERIALTIGLAVITTSPCLAQGSYGTRPIEVNLSAGKQSGQSYLGTGNLKIVGVNRLKFEPAIDLTSKYAQPFNPFSILPIASFNVLGSASGAPAPAAKPNRLAPHPCDPLTVDVALKAANILTLIDSTQNCQAEIKKDIDGAITAEKDAINKYKAASAAAQAFLQANVDTGPQSILSGLTCRGDKDSCHPLQDSKCRWNGDPQVVSCDLSSVLDYALGRRPWEQHGLWPTLKIQTLNNNIQNLREAIMFRQASTTQAPAPAATPRTPLHGAPNHASGKSPAAPAAGAEYKVYLDLVTKLEADAKTFADDQQPGKDFTSLHNTLERYHARLNAILAVGQDAFTATAPVPCHASALSGDQTVTVDVTLTDTLVESGTGDSTKSTFTITCPEPIMSTLGVALSSIPRKTYALVQGINNGTSPPSVQNQIGVTEDSRFSVSGALLVNALISEPDETKAFYYTIGADSKSGNIGYFFGYTTGYNQNFYVTYALHVAPTQSLRSGFQEQQFLPQGITTVPTENINKIGFAIIFTLFKVK